MRKLSLTLLALCLAAVATAGTARKKPAPKPTPEPAAEDALGEELYEALSKGLDAIADFREAGEELDRRKISRAAALRRYAAAREKMAASLEKGRSAKPAEGAEAAKDGYLVAASQALKAMDLIAESVKSGDGDGEEKGWRLGELALADLEALEGWEEGGEASSGGGSEPVGIGQSVGFNGNFTFADESTSMNLGLTYSRPITESVDYGLGLDFGMSGQASGSGLSSSYTITLNTGSNLFIRKHFLEFIPDKPWIVPFLGGSGGLNSSFSDSAGSSSSTSSSTNVTYGVQGGLLVFSNRNTAMNYQIQWENTANDSGGNSAVVTFTIGVRYML